MSLLDFLFPKRCVACRRFGEYVCADCFTRLSFAEQSVCFVCQRGTLDGRTHPRCRTKTTLDGVFVGLTYNTVSRKLIASLKYKPYVSDIAPYAADMLYERLIQDELFSSLPTSLFAFVPVPLHTDRMRQRGYNQSLLLARSLGKLFGVPTVDLLRRQKKTRSQVGLGREERIANIKDTFAIKTGVPLPQHVFLIDDVVTSGATMLEASKVLKRNGVGEVYGLALAHGN